MMQHIYILSNKGKNKNYVKKFNGSYCGFGTKKEAKSFTETEAKMIYSFLAKQLGQAYLEGV